MMDNRFFKKKDYILFGDVCELLGIKMPNDRSAEKKITNIARLDNATSSDITFFHNVKYAEDLAKTQAFACVISKKNSHLLPKTTVALIADEPYYALAILLKTFYSIKGDCKRAHISSSANISLNAQIGDNCHIADNVIISDGAVIGQGTFIGSNVTILDGVEIGENSHIEPNVTIGFAIIGKNAYIKTGARIGQQGFGFHVSKSGITDVMQIGKVVIGDDVQIGANCTVDRGSMNDTVIGSHSRLDNLVHVAHNVEIGEYCVIAAQTGIAGSTKIGNQCFFGGQVGIAGHLVIGNNVTIAAQSGVMRNIETGSKVAGSPATSVLNWHKQTVALQKLIKNNIRPKSIFQKIKSFLFQCINSSHL